jgi:hypothetical protein
VTFEDGALYERSFETPEGWVDLLAEIADAGFAEVRVTGTRLSGTGPEEHP